MTVLAPAALIPAIILAGLLGLVVGSFLTVVVHRVPAGIPLARESRCPRCDAPVTLRQSVPIVSWLLLRGRCASCGAAIPARYPLIELITGVAFIVVVWLFAVTGAGASESAGAMAVTVAAYLYLAAISVALTFIDLDTHRLPNAVVLPAYLVAGVAFTAVALLEGEWDAFLRAAIGMSALYAFYLALRLIRPAGMGGGDVKLAGVLGIYLGWLGWGALVVGAFAAFLLGGVFGIALIVAGRAGRRTAIPFGPWMIAGAWVGILAGQAVATWYVGLFAVS